MVLEIAEENAPLSVQAILKSLRENPFDLSEKEALAKEYQFGWTAFATKDTKEGMKVFKEKRKPNFIGE